MFVSIFRVFRFAGRNFWRNIWLALATISIIILTLISISFVELLNVLTQEAVATIKDRIDISIYFKPEVTPEEVINIKRKLGQLEQIKTITYVSRADSLKILEDKHGQDVLIKESLQELGTNPLGDTLVIKANDIGYYPVILAALEQSQYKGLIEDKNYEDNQAFLTKINSVTSKVKKIGWMVSGVFAIVAILIVFNTIRIAIYTKSEEIGVMKLVGADNWFIRAPFLVEAVLYAAIGTALTMLLLYPILEVIDPYILSFFDNGFSLVAYFVSHLVAWVLWHFVGILVLTITASSLAVGRYLDV
ncbi:MAG: hypothetical protein A2445_04760 [Candidatus Jacksonbacteria bacterium RIFOXYC2_FULL_44_29]|nr:MAG: hypothetical protein UW45_C0002G0001 [Parcubacteria group bacterium GW2011_GWC2_44_22]OGY75172.1 MAG: hypothetical protein A2240_01045 [Candidatus Jacksonbacteria bacterium RIFOXYA2_FULL_43_12]OGY75635.1 MAG: hypothetical protein A2295_04640 [Candidatus Jacksonbacteria bacterium RIFOXYB2_FULL_44_15]OGY77779.1 MAG: hypothetical protein A2445_04760 [Candidatus Jacksonbacteria bacterium RIFOXYC2_FULL_44_29]OGY79508.1 MAG: hypothetical protein A2550_02050 [Candidatus Jacksonbacteria bacteri